MSASSDLVAEAVVVLPADLHARPAGQVSQLGSAFDADVELAAGTRTARASSVLAVMSLGAVAGQQLIVRARGPQAAEAVAAVSAVLEAVEAVEAPTP
jgi:phosphotransferase system HPr (HPr) family protein